MFHIPRLSLMCVLSLIFSADCALAIQSFEEVSERDIPQKKILPLYVQHRIGNVSIKGWVQDRVRVTIKKKTLAESEALAKKEFQKLELISLETATAFELRVGHSRGVDLISKMKDAAQSQVQVDIEIKAPYQSELNVVLGDGKKLKIEEWRGGIKVTGKGNSIDLSQLNLESPIWVNCISCATELRDSKLEGHFILGSKSVLFKNVDGKGGLSIDSGNEEVKLENARGIFNIHTRSGRLTANRFSGNLRFQSIEGGSYFTQFSGNASVQTQSGQVMIESDDVASTVEIDTDKSDIQVSLPSGFTGGLDLMSLRGEIVVQFPYEVKKDSPEFYGPTSPGRLEGTIGSDPRIKVHAFSKQGGVRILRKSITR